MAIAFRLRKVQIVITKMLLCNHREKITKNSIWKMWQVRHLLPLSPVATVYL